MNNSDMPAAPITSNTESMDGAFLVGLTKREYFAGLAMQAFIASGSYGSDQSMAREAVGAADCLIWQLAREID